jgi:hypothetical protein
LRDGLTRTIAYFDALLAEGDVYKPQREAVK